MSNNKDTSENAKEEILLNRMYTGEYTEENIGHEIINLFKIDGDEKDQNYIYALPYGTIGPNHHIQNILLTSNVENGEFEIIAKADVVETLYNPNKECEKEKLHQEQAIYKYRDKCLYNIFRENNYNDEAVYATFKVENLMKPKPTIIFSQLKKGEKAKYEGNNEKLKGKEIAIVDKIEKYRKEKKDEKDNKKKADLKDKISDLQDNCIEIEKINKDNEDNEYDVICKIAFEFGQDSKRYLTEKTYVYEKVKEILEKEEWEEYKEIKKDDDIKYNKIEPTFLSLINKEYDESVYTNMLHYYFNRKLENNNILFNEFIKWLSNKKDNIVLNEKIKEIKKEIINGTITFSEVQKEKEIVYKEKKGRMDLVVEGEYNGKKIAIIIENKIKSDLNGKTKDGTQLDLYYNYYKDKKQPKYNVVAGLIFVPEYKLKRFKTNQDYQNQKVNYEIISYSDIEKFFEDFFKKYKDYKLENKSDNNKDDIFINNKYRDDFINALKIQTQTSESIMYNKFDNAIKRLEDEKIEYYVLILKATIKKKDNKPYTEYYVETTNNIVKRRKELDEYKEKRKNNNNKYKDVEKIQRIMEKKINPHKENETKDIEYVFDIENDIRKEIENCKEKGITNQEGIIARVEKILKKENIKY